MYLRLKSFRIVSLITTLALTIICFQLNFPEVSTNFYYESVMLAFFFILSLLTMSYMYGASKNYIIIVSIYFGVILLSTLLGMIFSYVKSILKYVLLIPTFIFLAPIAPLAELIPILNDKESVIFLILVVYVLIFFAYKLGRNKFKCNTNK